MGDNHLGEVVSLVFMAIGIGMDAFSVSLGLGMQQLRLKRIAIIGIVFGLFHVLLPFIGIIIGKALSSEAGQMATLVGGLLLVGIGAQMFFSAFKEGDKKTIQPIGFGLLILAIIVSVDGFSVGLGLGLSGVRVVVSLMLFGFAGMVLSWIGMLLGRKVRGFLGAYSEILGGSILFVFGLKIIFGL